MLDLFKAELLRFRSWTIAYAVVQVLVLGFLTRLVDLAQQPLLVSYLVFGAVYALTGLLLGLYQMGGYRRPSTWLNLLHRPLPQWRIAAALFGAGAVLLVVAVLLPLLFIAGWQEVMTARVLDMRHLLLTFSALLVALCGYLAGAYAMLGNKRYGACALVFLLLLPFSNATGIGAITMQLLALVWLAVMIAFAFKPDLSALPRRVPGVIVTTAPLLMGMWFAFMLVGFGGETAWIMQGTHPLNMSTPPRGGSVEADRAESKDLMIAGLKNSAAAEAPAWREQAAISELFSLGPRVREMPVRHELTNLMPMEFDDEIRRVRWVFSHDSMRFEGYSLADNRSVGQLGVAGNGAFPTPPLPGPGSILFNSRTVYQYDSDAKRVLPRAQLPAGETITGYEVIGERIALLSNRALYFYDGRELIDSDGMLKTRQRVPLPGKTGDLSSVDLMELIDGYLMSFTFTREASRAEGTTPFQQLLRIDGQGRVTPVARREISTDWPAVFRYQDWLPSPVLYAVQKAATNLFAGYAPYRDLDRPPVPRSMLIVAGVLMLLSLLGAIWHTQRVSLSIPARIVWIVVCGVIGIPALLSLWLLYPAR